MTKWRKHDDTQMEVITLMEAHLDIDYSLYTDRVEFNLWEISEEYNVDWNWDVTGYFLMRNPDFIQAQINILNVVKTLLTNHPEMTVLQKHTHIIVNFNNSKSPPND